MRVHDRGTVHSIVHEYDYELMVWNFFGTKRTYMSELENRELNEVVN
jgi:hypothetical protein